MKQYILAILLIVASAIGTAAQNAATLMAQGDEAFAANDFDRAQQLYQDAAMAYVADGQSETAEAAQCLHNLSRVFLSKNDGARGREYLEKAMTIRKRLFGECSEPYITSLNNYSLSFLGEKDYAKAIELQEKVMALCGKLDKPHKLEGMFWVNLGRAYYFNEDYAKAVTAVDTALEKVEKFGAEYEFCIKLLTAIYTDTNDAEGQMRVLALAEEYNQHELTKECNEPKCLLERAQYYYVSGNSPMAKETYNQIFAMGDRLTDSERLQLYEAYIQYLYSMKDFAGAGDYSKLDFELKRRLGRPAAELLTSAYNAGLYYYFGRDYDRALEMYADAKGYLPEGYSDVGYKLFYAMGNSWSGKKQHDKAGDCYAECCRMVAATENADSAKYAKALDKLATAEKFAGDYDSSIAHYREAIDLFHQLGDIQHEEDARTGLRFCLAYARKDEEVEMAEGYQELQNQKIRASIREVLGTDSEYATEWPRPALDLKYFGDLGYAQDLSIVGSYFEMLGEHSQALKYFRLFMPHMRKGLGQDFLLKNPEERARSWKDSMSQFQGLTTMLNTAVESDPAIADSLASLIYDSQLISKGILLSSAVEFDKIVKRQGDKEITDLYNQVKANASALQGMIEKASSDEDLKKYLEMKRATDALQLQLSRKCAEIGDYTRNISITHQDVLANLGPNEMAIEFLIPDIHVLDPYKDLYAVLLSQDMPEGKIVKVGNVLLLQQMAKDERYCDNPMWGILFWGEILKYAEGKDRIYFAPDGPVNYMGVEYLCTVGGERIGDSRQLVRLSSTREICKPKTMAKAGKIDIFGDIEYDDDKYDMAQREQWSSGNRDSDISFPYLDNTRREIDKIRSLVEEGKEKLTVNFYDRLEADKDNFIGASDRRPNILHIATHGEYIPDAASTETDAMHNSVLAFAGANLYPDHLNNPGIVNAMEIAGMDLFDCDLAVVSACKSGLGKIGEDGVFGLQRGFKNAGVRSLLVSLKEVVDESAADLMIDFYNNLFAGMPKSQALKDAQKAARDKNPDDPTWASFIIIDAI